MDQNQIQQLGSLLKSPQATPGLSSGTVNQLAQQSSQWGQSSIPKPAVTPTPAKSSGSILDTLKSVYDNVLVKPANAARDAVAGSLKDVGDAFHEIQSAGQSKTAGDFINKAGGGALDLAGAGARTIFNSLGAPVNAVLSGVSSIPTGGGKNVGDRANDVIKPIADAIGSIPAIQQLSQIPGIDKHVQSFIDVVTPLIVAKLSSSGTPKQNQIDTTEQALHDQNAKTAQQLENSKVLDTGDKVLSQDQLSQLHNEETTISNYAKQKVTPTSNAPIDYIQRIADTTKNAMADTGNTAALPEAIKSIQSDIVNNVQGGAIKLNSTALQQIQDLNPAKFSSIDDFTSAAQKIAQKNGGVIGKINAATDTLINRGIKAGEDISGDLKSNLKLPNIGRPTPETIDNYITNTYEKAIRPTVVGNKTAGALEAYRSKAISGVKSIVDNKNNLSFTTEDGVKEVGRLPENLNEATSAVGQTKTAIFEKYNALTKAATGKGVTIDFGKEVAPELDTIINNKALAISHPEAISYAEGLKARLEKIGATDPTTVEQVIQNYNNSLKNFYRNPTYERTSQAAIDALVANKARAALDSSIENASPEAAQARAESGQPTYQELKNQYGALKAIEADIAKKALVDSRKNVKGLIDYTDILSGGDVVRGIVTADPTLFAKGIAQKGIAAFYKYLNDPNRQISKMFETVDQLKYPQ